MNCLKPAFERLQLEDGKRVALFSSDKEDRVMEKRFFKNDDYASSYSIQIVFKDIEAEPTSDTFTKLERSAAIGQVLEKIKKSTNQARRSKFSIHFHVFQMVVLDFLMFDFEVAPGALNSLLSGNDQQPNHFSKEDTMEEISLLRDTIANQQSKKNMKIKQNSGLCERENGKLTRHRKSFPNFCKDSNFGIFKLLKTHEKSHCFCFSININFFSLCLVFLTQNPFFYCFFRFLGLRFKPSMSSKPTM